MKARWSIAFRSGSTSPGVVWHAVAHLPSDLSSRVSCSFLCIVVLLLASCVGNSPTPLADSPLPSIPAATATFWPTWTRMPSIIATPRPTDTPVPGCSMPPPVVTIKVQPARLKVGDTFAVSYVSSPGFAMVVEISLLMNSATVAVLRPHATPPAQNLTVKPFPLARVLTGVMSGYFGEGTFTLRAVEPGTADVGMSVRGDTGFCSYTNGQCLCGTTFKLIDSNRVQVLSIP
jgi:hypothetical protein